MARRSVRRTCDPAYPEHPVSEHRHRIERARRIMNEQGLDALLVARNVNVFYFSGTRFVFVGMDAPVALAPQSTVIITPEADVYCQRFGPFDTDEVGLHTTANASLEYYDDELELVNVLRDYGIGRGARIGTEWGKGLVAGINPLKFMALKQRLEDDLGASVVDATGVLWRIMAVKSELEIERMKVAVTASCRAMQRIYDLIEIGMNEMEVATLAKRFMLEEGADAISHAQVMAEGEGMKLVSCDAVDRPIGKGWVHLDLGARYKRYQSDVNRGIFLGRRPTPEEERLYACRRGVSELMDRLIKPGVCLDDVVSAADDYVSGQGYLLQAIGGVPFIGHGIGLEPYQQPNLVPSAAQPLVQDKEGKVVFEPGMMFTYEMSIELPGVTLPFFNIEDDVVVTRDGVLNMSGMLGRDFQVKD